MKVSLCFSLAFVLGTLSLSDKAVADKKSELNFRGKSLTDWRPETGDWQLIGKVDLDSKNERRLRTTAGDEILVNGTRGRTVNLRSKYEHGDVQAKIEFLLPRGSNSGVYFQSRYEIQILDSWGVKKPTYGDCGGIYQRLHKGKGFEGRPPKVNAAKAPGKWQTLDVIFRAPRFDRTGKKVTHARFEKVVLNGQLIHENVSVTGPTQAAAFQDEKPTGPLMLQGDHGPIAFRLIQLTSLASSDENSKQPWQKAKGPLMTRWAKEVSPNNVLSEYPRPSLVRDRWQNLNGLWDYSILPREAKQPERYDGRILVPFPVESALSGVMKSVGRQKKLWYRRTFSVNKLAPDQRLLLNFGAVDWHSIIWINGQKVGEHKGGYDPFLFDITEALVEGRRQEIVVSVWDPTDKGFQPRGKQVENPRGIWYTAVTGIWQTVWLETVPTSSISSLKTNSDIDAGTVRLKANGRNIKPRDRLQVKVFKEGKFVVGSQASFNREIVLKIKDPKLWSPDSPFLYDLHVTLLRDGEVVDQVKSYFGMREISLGKDKKGITRILLNGKPLFHFGPLDQGWWPDGLYTAPTDDALRYDIEITKKLGFNMARKHVKVEPERWYYHCDKLGLMVWQDLPNGDRHIGPNDPDIKRSPESATNFRRELKALIDSHHQHPCIVTWVPFNEGWGQFQTDEILAWVKKYDPTRLVDGPSGWTDRRSGDIHDIHRYPGPAMPDPEEERAVVLGEFGGLGLPIAEHLWWNKRNWGYRTYTSQEQLRRNYLQLMKRLLPLYSAGLSGAIYTQTTDVEGEVNGLMTYDRGILKLDAPELAKIHRQFYLPPPKITVKELLSTGQKEGQTWRYTNSEPGKDWYLPMFDDSKWLKGTSGFGTKETPGTIVRTAWETKNIWLRKSFQLKETSTSQPHFRIHHDEDAEIYLNGQKVLTVTGYQSGYVDFELNEQAKAALKSGRNTLAVHCRQTTGGQYIDVGLVDVVIEPGE